MDNPEDLDALKSQLTDPKDFFKKLNGTEGIKIAEIEGEEKKIDEVVENKFIRQEIDKITQLVAILPKSRERSLCITKLEEATMWLGMDLKRLGTPNPYPNSKDPSTGSTIDPTADGLKFSGIKD